MKENIDTINLSDKDYEVLAENVRVVNVDMEKDIIVCRIYLSEDGDLFDSDGGEILYTRELQWKMHYHDFVEEAFGGWDGKIPTNSKGMWGYYSTWDIDKELHSILLENRLYMKLDSFRKPAARMLRMIKEYEDHATDFKRVFCAAAKYGLVKREDYDTECRNFLAGYDFFNKYELAEKIIRAGNSKIFNDWHEHTGISMEAFLEELDWLYEAPVRNRKGKLRRELGITYDGKFVHMDRAYYSNGDFAGFYDEKTGYLASMKYSIRARLNYDDRV